MNFCHGNRISADEYLAVIVRDIQNIDIPGCYKDFEKIFLRLPSVYHKLLSKLLFFSPVMPLPYMVYFYRKLFIDLCGGELKPFVEHPTRLGESLFLLFDFTHNFKNIFNNSMSKGRMAIPTRRFESILGESCKTNFNHIKQLYALEEHKSLKIAHALKKVLLNPSNVAKTSPQHALSKTVIICSILCNVFV